MMAMKPRTSSSVGGILAAVGYLWYVIGVALNESGS
jgi:hypothetical protein